MFLYVALLVVQLNNPQQVIDIEMTPTEIAVFKRKVQSKSATIKSIKTDFTQKKKMEFLENDIISNGKMLLSAAGFLKWQYTNPNKYSIIFKSNQIYINDNGTKSTANVNQRLFKKISTLISGSIKGDIFNDAEFSYSFYKRGSNVVVKLTTKDKTMVKYIKNIELTFPKEEVLVSEVKLIEPSGDYTLISFKNRKINVPIDKAEFNH
jgi:outer membrane lipoprotein carrier protein